MQRGKRMVAMLALPIVFFALVLVYVNVKQTERNELVQATSEYRACEANLKELDSKAKLYLEDNEIKQLKALNQLVPDYLKELPTCPSGGTYYYERVQVSEDSPMLRTYSCLGNTHKDVASIGYPKFRSDFGLLEVPELKLAE